MGRLDGKVVILTGATGDLGTEIARRCAAEGARVALMDVVDASELAGRLDGLFVEGDVSQEQSWETVVAAASERLGGVDVLINNAAIYRRAAMPDVTTENFDAHYRVNVLSVFLGIRACLPAMLARGGGSVVNVGSVAGMHAGPGLFSYAVSKWAVRGITKAASADLAPQGIRVNSVIPGLIESALSRTNPAGYNEKFIAETPLRRIGRPGDVAAGVIYLASDESSFVTGTDLVIDGGLVS